MAYKPKLAETDEIITAWAEYAPNNQPLWFLVRSHDGKLRTEVLQPEHQGRDIMTLFRVAAAVQDDLVHACRIAVG